MGTNNTAPFISFWQWNQNPLPMVATNFWQVYLGPVNSVFTATTSNLSTYYFSGQTPDNQLYWIKGDNRNPQIKLYLIDTLLYHLHSRINPRNIPELRNTRYKSVIEWLKKVEMGKVSLEVPIVVPTTGNSIVFGSYPKQNNWY
jgi:hypothetical protein